MFVFENINDNRDDSARPGRAFWRHFPEKHKRDINSNFQYDFGTLYKIVVLSLALFFLNKVEPEDIFVKVLDEF